MLRVYIAGSISNPDPTQLLKNLSLGIGKAVRLLKLGYIPFCPFIDFQFFLHPEGRDLSLEQIQEYSKQWLILCDAIYVLPNSENSLGTQAELEIAHCHEIPIVRSEEALQCLRESLRSQ